MLKGSKIRSTILILFLVGLLLPTVLGLFGRLKAQDGVVNFLTYHMNNARTGWNANETQLTPANVRTRLHKLWDYNAINGQIFGAPLYYNVGGREYLFVVTETNWLYAFDVTNGVRPQQPLYAHVIGTPEGRPERFLTQAEFEAKLNGGCGDINPFHGITSTPVIDPDTNILYLVDLTVEQSLQVYKAHAIDLFTGREVTDPPGWPVTIHGRFDGSDFEPWAQTQRSALTLHDGVLYILFSSRCDAYSWHGWVFGVNVKDPLQPLYTFNTSPDGNGAGMWGQGGFSIDPLTGAGYVVTGNGTVNFPPLSSSGRSYGMSVLRLNPYDRDRPFSRDRLDFFTISDYGPTNARDTDLGGSSALVIPDQPTKTPHLLLTAGKDGRVYLMDRDNMGGLSTLQRPTELQRLRVNRGLRVAPSYYETTDPRAPGARFVYVVGAESGRAGEGRYTDWEDGPSNMWPSGSPAVRLALSSGPAMAAFPDPSDGQLFVAWVDNTDDRAVMIKRSPDGFDWSAQPIPVGGQAAIRTSPALAAFKGKLYISWVDDDTHRIMIKSSSDGLDWPDDAQMLDAVAESESTMTYTSLAAFNDNLYLAFVSSSDNHEIVLRSMSNGETWSAENIYITPHDQVGQSIPVSAPFLIPFNRRLFAFWLRNRDDRTIVFKVSNNGQDWPADLPRSFNESAGRNSGLSGLVLDSIVEGSEPGPPRLHIFFLSNANRDILVKSLDTSDPPILEGSNFGTYERTGAGSKVGAVLFRGRPRYAFVANNFNRNLMLKTGAAAYRGRGLVALQLTADRETEESRFYPAWTSSINYDYQPGSPFVTSNGRRDGVVWVTEGGVTTGTPALHAYDAVSGEELFNSNDRPAADRITNGGRKFVSAVAVNGRIYIATNGITAYGLQ